MNLKRNRRNTCSAPEFSASLKGNAMNLTKTLAALAVIAFASAPALAQGSNKSGKPNVALIALGGAVVVGAALALGGGGNGSTPASN